MDDTKTTQENIDTVEQQEEDDHYAQKADQ